MNTVPIFSTRVACSIRIYVSSVDGAVQLDVAMYLVSRIDLHIAQH